MIVAMQDSATEEHIQRVIERMVELGFNVHRTTGAAQTILAGVGTPEHFDVAEFKVLSGVHDAYRISSPYKLAGRSFRPEGTKIKFPNGVVVGGEEVVIMAGPCSVESREQILDSAKKVAAAGGKFLRGGAYKPRCSPYSFQGMGVEGLKLLREVADETGLLVITEVMEISQIEIMLPYIDCFQIGARNMQNFNLLRELGHVRKPCPYEARHLRHHRRGSSLGGVHPLRRQLRPHPLRARHPHLRDLHPQHHGHLRHPRAQEADPPTRRSATRRTASASATSFPPWRSPRSPPGPTAF